MTNDYYVYAYYDPRDFKLFYIGKGKGNRKQVHLRDYQESEKVEIIEEIQKENLEPIIKVIAKDLTEQEALLVEATLIWDNFDSLSNQNKGHHSKHFRPAKTLHKDLQGFDYKSNIYYVNIGEGDHRDWIDCLTYNFVSAGGDPKWSDPLKRLQIGDIIIAYLKSKGYVGVGRVTQTRVKAAEFKVNGTPLRDLKSKLQQPNLFENQDNNDLAQYCVGVRWIKKVDKDNAIWEKNKNLFTTQQIVASMLNQTATIEYLNEKFDINIFDYIDEEIHSEKKPLSSAP